MLFFVSLDPSNYISNKAFSLLHPHFVAVYRDNNLSLVDLLVDTFFKSNLLQFQFYQWIFWKFLTKSRNKLQFQFFQLMLFLRLFGSKHYFVSEADFQQHASSQLLCDSKSVINIVKYLCSTNALIISKLIVTLYMKESKI